MHIIDSNLPIVAKLPDILKALQLSQQVVLQAEPGAGKSTQVPLSLLKADWLGQQKIIMLEPRRLSAQSIARYLAKLLNEPIGQTIGYHIRNDKKSSAQTKLEIVTEGILTRRIQSDPELKDVALIIFDEFHERSLQADLSLALSLEIQAALREDLKLLIMSATLDAQQIQTFLPQAHSVFCEGRQYPVDIEYLQSYANPHQNFSHKALNALMPTLSKAFHQTQQDILVFLPGQREILNAIAQAKELSLTPQPLLLPLYAGLSAQDQDLATRPGQNSQRKIIFATNIAETSLTLPNIGCVIDSGLARQQTYDPSSGMSRLQTQTISQAASQQRCGRAGRLGPGKCYRLWTQAENNQRAPHETVEILRADLSQLCLEVALWGETDIYQLNWLTPPPNSHVAKAKALLIELGLMTPQGTLPAIGQQTLQMGFEPRVAKMMSFAQQSNIEEWVVLACDLAAILSEQDFLKNLSERPSVDVLERLSLLHDYVHARQHHQPFSATQVHLNRLKQVEQLGQQWQKRLGVKRANTFNTAELAEWTAALLAIAYPDRIAKRRPGLEGNYLLSNGKAASISNEDRLGQAAWLIAAEIDGQRQGGRIFLACEISPSHLESLYQSQITRSTRYEYDAQKNTLLGITRQQFKGLVLAEQPSQEFDASAFLMCLKQALRQTQLSLLNWTPASEHWLKRAQWLHSVQETFPDFSMAALLESMDDWLMPYCTNFKSLNDLKKLNLLALLQNRLDYSQQQTLDKDAPAHYQTPSGQTVAIHYELHRSPFVSVKLQELFGQVHSPILGGCQGQALTFELLSPAMRPLQVTADLHHFWQNSYIEIAKEMRGRYPKHRWPEQPLLEKPGHSHKKRFLNT
ncbi:ATP-dependent helicase HrpB [Thiosulfativibrio zosterae]|uniref:ATP-dependent helicase HrpB n=1 Tax=Thiosulfativibrio zosterae TaxID=2675053 RepID=A0A6F8PN84_9GAMM|nr:ATP-dependent helicase HrpB [Thiosulfativibrio zosterae]BBP43497.1 ATP-dependent helicase HrpB [Thiosulfativibrio zosterae]